MIFNNDAVNRIVRELDRCNYDYTVSDDRSSYNIYIKDTPELKFFIRCRHSELNKIIRIHWVLPVHSNQIRVKRKRLLEACDITNREDFIKAKILDDCVDITYEIPESAWEIAEKVVLDVMYYFHMRIDNTLFDKAINTEEDLYQYYNARMQLEIKGDINENVGGNACQKTLDLNQL